MNGKRQCIIIILIVLCYALRVKSQLPQCSSPVLSSLLSNGIAYTAILSENSKILSEIPLLGQTNNAWIFTNNSRTVKIALQKLSSQNKLGYYVNGIGVRTAASASAACQNETELNLLEYAIRYSYGGSGGDFEILRRVYPVPSAEREIRLRFPVRLADRVEITRFGGYANSTALYCVQFELYGCPIRPIQREVLSYDYTQSNLFIFFHITRFFLLPNFNPTDARYLERGVCDSSYYYCSGGIGILMDGFIGTSSVDVITESHSIGFHCPNVQNFLEVCRKHFAITLTQLFHVDTIVIHGYVGSYFGDVILSPKVSLTNGPSEPTTNINTVGNLYALEVHINSTTRFVEFDIRMDRNSIALLTEIEVMSQGQNLAWLLTTYSPHSVQTNCPNTVQPTPQPCSCETQTLPTGATTNSTTLANFLSPDESNKTLLILIIVLLVIVMVEITVNLASSLYGNILSSSLQKKILTQSLHSPDNQIPFNPNYDKSDALDNSFAIKNRSGAYEPSPPPRARGISDNYKGKGVKGEYGCEERIYNPLYSQKYESVEYSTVEESATATKTNPFMLNQGSIDLDDYNRLERVGEAVGKNKDDPNPVAKEVTQYSNIN